MITAGKEQVLNERRRSMHFGRTLVTGCSGGRVWGMHGCRCSTILACACPCLRCCACAMQMVSLGRAQAVIADALPASTRTEVLESKGYEDFEQFMTAVQVRAAVLCVAHCTGLLSSAVLALMP